jgi:hypothetical protein
MMTRTIRILLALTTLFAAVSFGFPFNKQKFLDWANKYAPLDTFHDNWGKYKLDRQDRECGHFVMRAIAEAAPELALFMKWKGRYNPKCNVGDMRYNDGLPTLGRAIPWLKKHCGWNVDGLKFVRTDVEPAPPELVNQIRPWLEPGDIVGLIPWNGSEGHAGIISDNSLGWLDHNSPGWTEFFSGPFANYWKNTPVGETIKLNIVRPQNSPNTDVLSSMALDSTWTRDFGNPAGHCGHIFHQWRCCWHENTGATWPWLSDSTGYACLSWQEHSGTTIDSLVSPRINLAGCSSAVFMLTSRPDLDSGLIEVRGSTDNGASWPYQIGDGLLQSADIPWADNKKEVRIAWIYQGSVQADKSWCIDDVEIWAEPSRNRDAAVNGVAHPCGIMTQGKHVVPAAYVWNHGKQTETLAVTMRIDTIYTDIGWAQLDPYADTLLRFTTWTAVPGIYTATCYTSLDTDECRANDTAALTFRVVADTWVNEFPVYGGGGLSSGACFATLDSDDIFCVTGQSDRFAKYVVSQNLWKNRTCTPEDFATGAALAYPGAGNNLYALRGFGSQSFYGYRADCNYWESRTQFPVKVYSGGSLTGAGGNYLYALRGYNKTSFYRYSITGNSWQSLTPAPGGISSGGCLVWTGGDSLFALRGGGHTDFYCYRVSTNTWSTATSTPAEVDYGGAMAFDPQTSRIYAFFGDGTSYFYAYYISNNTWSSRCYAPGPVRNGAGLAYCDYSFYGGLGTGQDTNFWRYSPPVGGLDEPEPGPVPAELPVEQVSVATTDDVRVGDDGAFGEELITYDPTDKLTPDYAPSDSWISYTADDTSRGCLALYRIRSTGGQPEMVTYDDRTYENPKWSHDGAWLIAKADDGIFRLDPNGMSDARLTQGITALPRWSENDSWVTYERWDTTLHTHRTCRVRFDGTQDTCLSADSGQYLSPQPASDSEVVCVKFKEEVYQLCLVRNGQTIWLTSDYMNNASPSLSPDRQWCTYEKLDESGYWQVYRIRVNGTDEARLSDGSCNCMTPTYSPDGNHIAYSKWPADSTGSSEFSRICYIPDSGGQETALNPPNAIRKNPCWSHDCSYIVYEKVVASGAFGGKKKKFAQLARARTRIRYTGVEEVSSLPSRFALYQNRPNPFHSRTTIRYALPLRAQADLTIYDITGRSVKKLVQCEQKPGYYTVRWRGTDARGRSVAAGSYFYVLKANGKIAQKRMLLVR